MIPPSQWEGGFQLGAGCSKGEAIPLSTPPTRFHCSGSQAHCIGMKRGPFPHGACRWGVRRLEAMLTVPLPNLHGSPGSNRYIRPSYRYSLPDFSYLFSVEQIQLKLSKLTRRVEEGHEKVYQLSQECGESNEREPDLGMCNAPIAAGLAQRMRRWG